MIHFANIRSATVFLVAMLCCTAQGASHPHQAFYITFQVPNGTGTLPVGINDSLSVTGYYNGKDGKTHGFVRHVFGKITTFDVPGSIYTQPIGINNAGEITGVYEDVPGFDRGFIRSPEGHFTTFNPGGAGGSSVPRAIDASGMVIGFYTTTNIVPPGFGFIRYPDGGLVTFGISGSSYVNPVSINTGGEIAGQYFYNGDTQVGGFVRCPDGDITTFEYAEGIVPTAINQAGTITGWYGTTGFHGFVRSAEGVITPFDPPGTIQTQYISINREGFVTGSYLASKPGIEHGFLRSPQGRLTTIDPPGSTQTNVTAINDLGVITGSYSGNIAPYGGAFLRIPQFDCDDDQP